MPVRKKGNKRCMGSRCVYKTKKSALASYRAYLFKRKFKKKKK